jgi:hypothetical protein
MKKLLLHRANQDSVKNLFLLFHGYLGIGIVIAIILLFSDYDAQLITTLSEVRDYIVNVGFEKNSQLSQYIVKHEAKERLIYILVTLLAPLILFLSMFFWQKYILPKLNKNNKKIDCLHILSESGVIFSGFCLWIGSFLLIASSNFLLLCSQSEEVYKIQVEIYRSLYVYVVLVALIIAESVIYYGVFANKSFKKKTSIAVFAIMVAYSFFICSYNLFDEYDLKDHSVNFNPVVYPIIQTYLGKIPAIDLKSLYGLHPFFFQPLFHLFEPSILTLSVILTLISLISLISIAFCLFKIIENKIIALIAFLSIIYFRNFAFPWWPSSNTIGFQVESIRIFFPSLLLSFLYFFLRKPTTPKYFFGLLFFSFATIWNIDSGFAAFIVLFLILGYEKCFLRDEKFSFKNAFIHLFWATTILFLVWFGFFAFLKISSGKLPDSSLLAYGQKAAFEFGYTMMTIKSLDFWYFAVAIYVSGIVFAIYVFLNRKFSLQNHFILVLTLLGIGIFTYYIGRSHNSNLFHIGYPALMLLGIFADKFCAKFTRKNFVFFLPKIKSEALFFGFPLMFLCYFSAVSFFQIYNNKSMRENFISQKFKPDPDLYWIKQVDFIKKRIPASEEKTPRSDILILQNNNLDYYFALKLRARFPLNYINLNHMFYKEEYAKLLEEILAKREKWVIWSQENSKEYKLFSSEEVTEIRELLQKNYKILDQMNDEKAELIIYERM